MSVPTRVRYRELQTLRWRDLADEQAYLIAMRRRHMIGPHRWGIVHGLGLVPGPHGVVVRPGMAVDGYGRELFVTSPLTITASEFHQQSDVLDVWLLYNRVGATPPQRGRWDCGADQQSRWIEETLLCLAPASAQDVDPRAPDLVPDTALDFGPAQEPPDNPAQRWPVYLGRVRRDRSTPQRPSYTADTSRRAEAHAVGESVVAPSGRARLQVGSELASDHRRFAVSVPDGAGSPIDRLVIDREGAVTVQGHCTVNGTLSVAPTAATSALGLGPMDTPAQAAPWQIYHTIVKQGDKPVHQLRVEIGNPGDKGDPTRYAFAIGAWSDKGHAFQPCLSVRADCTVTLHGNVKLAAGKQVIQGPVQLDPTDPRFQDALLKQWLQGLTGASNQVSGLGALDIQVNAPASVVAGTTLTYTVTVTNTSQATITNAEVIENLTAGAGAAQQGQIGGEATVAAQSSFSIGRTYAVPNDLAGPIIVAVVVLGVGPLGNRVYAANTATVQSTTEQPE
jgi:uncharacterized repeat protein (TIGR01451 family)